jgi:hypothetical protein
MTRRFAFRSALLAGFVAAALVAPFEATAGEQGSDAQVVAALKDVESALRRQEEARNAHWGQVRRVQEQQRIFLKAWHRYPQFIEVGARVWEGLIEWHVREQQMLNVTRTADGRYVMTFMFTTLLMRPDLEDNYVGPGLDSERAQ